MSLVLSDALSSYAASLKLQSLQSAEIAHLIDAFVNWVGCAIAGSATPSVEVAARAYSEMAPSGKHISLAQEGHFELVHAISLDCLSSAALGFDDTHLETILHPTGPVAAALLGAARTRRVSGQQYLEALFIGMEIECRVGLAFTSPTAGSKRGWYATGIAGGVGAAAAVGRLLNFGEAQLRNAFGLAAARASGNRGTHGSMAAAYVPALAAESGFIAAKLTEAGFSCGGRALDGANGLLGLVATTPAIDRALRDLGTASEATRTAFKPYPAGIILHPIIDACLSLVRDHKVMLGDVQEIRLTVPTLTQELASSKHPKDELEAATSIFYWAAVTIVNGRAGIAEAGPAMLHDVRIAALKDRISVSTAPDLADDQCRLVAKLSDGRRLEVSVDHAVGSLDRPMSSAQIDEKFLSSAPPSFTRRVERLLSVCRSVFDLDDVNQILKV